MQTDLIIVSEYCNKCHIEPSFIHMLEEDGLIDIQETNQEQYLYVSQLADLERYARMYYDLSINIAGIDAIQHLLNRVEQMQQEIRFLQNRLNFYNEKDFEEIEDY